MDAENCTDTQLYWNRTCTEIDDFCTLYNYDNHINNTYCYNETQKPEDKPLYVPVQNISFRVSPSEEFWYKKVLELSVTFRQNGTEINIDSDDINTKVNNWYHWGKVNWKLAGCLLLCWSLVAASLIKG